MTQEKKTIRVQAQMLTNGLCKTLQRIGFTSPYRVACIIVATHLDKCKESPDVVRYLWEEAMDIEEWRDRYSDEQIHLRLLGLATEVSRISSLGTSAAAKTEKRCLEMAYELYGITYG